MFATLLVVLALFPSVHAVESPYAFQEEMHEGKVVAVGADFLTVLDNKDDDTDKFAVNAETKITRNGKPARLSDIQVSDRAKVTATQVGGKLVAKIVAVYAAE